MQGSQQKYEREQSEAEARRESEIYCIKSEFQGRRVRVGEAVCSRGHNNVTAYNKYGNHPSSDDFEDTIAYVYCSVCGKNDYNSEVRNFTTYNFEEWCRMKNQSYAQEIAKMNQQIQEKEQKKWETLARIEQEKNNRNVAFERELEKEKRLQEQVVSQEKKINEERLKIDEEVSKGRINSTNMDKINRLNRELAEKKQELENHIKQSKIEKETSQQRLEAYIEQLINK